VGSGNTKDSQAGEGNPVETDVVWFSGKGSEGKNENNGKDVDCSQAEAAWINVIPQCRFQFHLLLPTSRFSFPSKDLPERLALIRPQRRRCLCAFNFS